MAPGSTGSSSWWQRSSGLGARDHRGTSPDGCGRCVFGRRPRRGDSARFRDEQFLDSAAEDGADDIQVAELDDVGLAGPQARHLAGADDQAAVGTSRIYLPRPAPRWWNLSGQAREAEIGRLRGFVEQVYRPGFGHLAARLRPCWESHDLCLYCLDIAAELHAVLYLQSRRTIPLLNGQAEYATRVLPALADLMSTETRSGCHHHTPLANGGPIPTREGRP